VAELKKPHVLIPGGMANMLDTKKRWRKPKLIILERGRPEELVLAGCKIAGILSNSQGKKNSCLRTASCTGCNIIEAS
jgi:hypothetical protein